jgi:uncharacterized membrane protein
MVAFEPQAQPHAPKAVIPYQNVQGWERGASIGGGLLLIAKGLRKGGLLGLASLALGGLGVVRGVTGRCEAKRVLGRALTAPDLQQCSDTQPMPQLNMEAQAPVDRGADASISAAANQAPYA